MTVKPGDIITMSSFDKDRTAHFASPKHVFVMLLLGEAVKTAKSQFDPGAALRRLGWLPESDFVPVEPSTGSLEDRATELAANMKYMAALHRANEDVAAADEFAQGAELVRTMAAELEAARIDQEIANFARDITITPSLAEALDPILEPLAGKLEEPSTREEWYAGMKLVVDAAKASGLWPLKPERVLTDEAQADRDDFDSEDSGCSCHTNPPCGHCTHPGNPLNQDDDSCWMVKP